MSLQYQFKITFDQIDGLDELSEGKRVYIEWKRGSKKQNAGKTDRASAKDGKVVGIGEIQMKATLHLSSSKKGGASYDPKYLGLTLRRLDESSSVDDSPSGSSSSSKKRRLKASTIGKTIIDLSSFAGVTEKKEKISFSKTHTSVHLTITSSLASSRDEQSPSETLLPNEPVSQDQGASSPSRTPSKKSKSGSRLFSTPSASKLFGSSSSKSSSKKSSSSSSKSKSRHHSSRASASRSNKGDADDQAGSDEDLSISERSCADSSVADDTTAGDWSDDDQLADEFNQHAAEDEREIPLIIQDMVQLLSQSSALSIQGLFQLTTPPATVEAVTNMYKSGVAVSEEWTDFPAAANVLKTVLSSRPDPLIPSSLLVNFFEALKKTTQPDKLGALRVLLSALPPRVYVLLAYVTELLWKIVLSPVNRISSHNVATIFLEAYFRQESDEMELKKKFEQMQRAVELVEILVQNFDALFSPVNVPPHHAKRMLPSHFSTESGPDRSQPNPALKKTHKRGSSLSLLPGTLGSSQARPSKYEFRLIFKGIHDLMPVEIAPKTTCRVSLRWHRGKKSKNQGHSPAIDMDGTPIINFPPDTNTKFKISLFRNPKGYFCSKSVDFEIVYDREGKAPVIMAGSLDLADAINALEASGEDASLLSTESIVSFPSLISTKSPPTKLLVSMRARSTSGRNRGAGSDSIFKRLSTTFADSPVEADSATADFDHLDGPSQQDINMYVMMANTIASHQNDEVFLQDWATVRLAESEKSEKRWTALTMGCLILFKPYEVGVSPSPTDPKDVFDISSITEIEYGQHSDTEFALGTPMGMLTFTMNSRKKRDQWVAELRRIIPLVKQEAGRILKMSAQEARRMIDQLTKTLEEVTAKLQNSERELQQRQDRIHELESVELEKLKKKVSHYRASLKKVEQSDKEHLGQLEALQASTRQTLDTLGSSHSTEVQKMQAILEIERQTHENALKSLEEKHKQATEALQEQHEKTVHQLHKKHEEAHQQMEELRKHHEATLQENRTKSEKALEALQQQQHAAVTLLESRIELANKQLAEERSKHQGSTQVLSASHERSVETLKAEMNATIAQLNAQHATAQKQHEDALLRLKTQHAQDVKAALAESDASHRKDVEALASKHQLQMTQLEETHQKQLDLKAQSHAELETQKQKLVEQMSVVKAECANNMVELQSTIEGLRQQLVDQQVQHEKSQKKVQQTLHDEKLRHADEIREVKRIMELTHASEISQLHQQLGQTQGVVVQELTSQIELLKSELSKSQAQSDETLASQARQHAQELAALQETLDEQLATSRQTLFKTESSLQKLTSEHSDAVRQSEATLQQLREEHSDALRQSEATLQQLREEHSATLKQLKAESGSDQEHMLSALQEEHRAEVESIRSTLGDENAELRRKLDNKRSKIDALSQQLEKLKRMQEEQLLMFQIAQKSQYEIRKLFFAKHSWDAQYHLLDAKKLYTMFQESDSFRMENMSNHKLLETTIENIVDVLEQNQKNLPLLMFYLSFTLTLLDLLQRDVDHSSLVSSDGLTSLQGLTPGFSCSSRAQLLSWRQREVDEDVKAWLMEQLGQIAWHLIFQYFLPTVYSHLDEISVVSILFSEQYAIFEGSLSSKTPGEEITSYLSDVVGSIESNHIYLVIAEELIRRIFYRIESQVFNTLMESSREDVVTAKRGFQIKMALSEIDSWIQQSHATGTLLGAAIFNIARSQLSHVRAACMVLLTATNAEMFQDSTLVKEMFQPLTATQIHRLLTRYHPDRSSPEPVPPSVLSFFTNLAHQDPPNSNILLQQSLPN